MPSNTIELAMELIRQPSVSPDNQGCQEKIISLLEPLGVQIERLRFGNVDNIWLRKGTEPPVLCFAGHTDVVPPGPLELWHTNPFEPTIKDGMLYRRGAADMKGSLAAMVTGCQQFLEQHTDHRGSIAFLITSDEEGECINGTRKVIEQLSNRNEIIDWCIVGEPSSANVLGDTIKNGRRGSLHGYLTVQGIQGHIAYPQKANNPIHQVVPALAELTSTAWDQGNEHFQPTSFQIWHIDANTSITNVIPGQCQINFNFRFSPEVTEDQLKQRVRQILDQYELQYSLEWHLSGQPFQTLPGQMLDAVSAAIYENTGVMPQLSTSGGTSDGRFTAPTGTQVIEFGPVNDTVHKVNECARAEDLNTLSITYQHCLKRLLT